MDKKLATGLIALTLVAVPVISAAAEFRVGEQPSLPTDERVADDLYMAGGNVSANGTVQGDFVVVGGNLLISSPVSQDLAAGGGSITVLGAVGDDARLGGGNVIVNARIGDDLVAGTGQLQVSGAGIGGDVLWGGGVMRLEAPVAGDVRAGGGEVFINARVNGSVYFNGDKLVLGENADIRGNLVYESPREAQIAEGAVVAGATEYTERTVKADGKKKALAFLSIAYLVKLLMTLASALAVGLFFKRYSSELVHTALERPLLELGRGFLALVAIPIASIILLVTVLGIPLGVLGLIAFAGLIIFGSILAPVLVGSYIDRLVTKGSYRVTWLTILIGVLVLAIIKLVPFVGWIVSFAIFLVTIGAIVKIKWGMASTWR